MKKLLSIILIPLLLFISIISTGCTQKQDINKENNIKEENVDKKPDPQENNNNNNNNNGENKIEKTKTELRKVRIFAFDYQTPELYYYDTQIKVTDNALVKALTNELQHNLPEDRFLTLTDEVGVTSAKLDKENGILTVVFNEAFTEKMLLGSVTESGLLASILSTYAYNYGVDKVTIYFGDKLYTSLRGELPEGYFKVDYSDAKPLYN